MDATTAGQLTLIREITTALSQAGVPHWLFGGWAVDFFVGGLTRPHQDVEFIVWQHDLSRLRSLLEERGYRPAFSREDAAAWWSGDTLVEFDFIERDDQGRIVTPGPWKDWPWPAETFSAPPGRLGEVVCPLVSGMAQLETKEGYRRHPAGAPPRPKDLADIAHLRRVLAERPLG